MTNFQIDWRGGDASLTPALVEWACAARPAAATERSLLAATAYEIGDAATRGEDWPGDRTVEAYKAALQALGRNPNRYRISSDALLRRCRRDGAVPSISPIVDANNVISMRSGWPVGCYDAAKVSPDVVHRLGREGENLGSMGKGDLDIARLPILADADGPFGSPISDSLRARTSENTQTVLFVAYILNAPPLGALAALAPLIATACDAADLEIVRPPRLVRAA